jgi:hypothetical protein
VREEVIQMYEGGAEQTNTEAQGKNHLVSEVRNEEAVRCKSRQAPGMTGFNRILKITKNIDFPCD